MEDAKLDFKIAVEKWIGIIFTILKVIVALLFTITVSFNVFWYLIFDFWFFL